MRTENRLNRRAFLARGGALGCSIAAAPLISPIALAAAPGDKRLVVIILRGAMDGLDVVRPVGDPAFAALRPTLAGGADPLPLDGFFALHPALKDLHSLWASGELGFAHAVSTPYRDKRSHFDGQDILETGAAGVGGRDGWLNRALGQMEGTSFRTGFAVGREALLILAGEAPISHWAPDAALALTPQSRRLLARMYREAPLFKASMDEAIALTETLNEDAMIQDYDEAQQVMMTSVRNIGRRGGAEKIARFTAQQLLGETRIASFSINGWDTHAAQKRDLARALGELQSAILTLKQDLGTVWRDTAVLAMTEFGRTAHENGTGGTDHGTGGALILAGGAISGGKMYGAWPGLGELDLYQGRDLMPTSDLRAFAATALAGLFDLGENALETRVFPGLDIRDAARIIA